MEGSHNNFMWKLLRSCETFLKWPKQGCVVATILCNWLSLPHVFISAYLILAILDLVLVQSIILFCFFPLKMIFLGTGEMAQWLSVHTVLATDLISIPSTHMGWLQPPVTTVPEESKTSGLLNTLRHMNTCTQNWNKIKFFSFFPLLLNHFSFVV